MTANEDRQRYARAAATLNDARLAAQFARIIHGLASVPYPAGRILSEGELLQRSRRVGLLAGSFNPLTRAHVALAEAARAAGRLDAILWTLSVVTVDKERVERASLVDRLLQLHAFIGAGPDALALMNRGLYAEQADVARALVPQIEELVIVVGFDKIVQILDPRYYDDRDAVLDRLFACATLLVAPRVDEDEASLYMLIQREENRRYRDRIAFCPVSRRFRHDSSSESRAIAGKPMAGHRLRRLLPPEGRALAQVAGAYWHGEHGVGRGRRRRDSYPLRQEVIEWLITLDPAQTADAPGLDILIAARGNPSHPQGVTAAWLAATSQASEDRGDGN